MHQQLTHPHAAVFAAPSESEYTRAGSAAAAALSTRRNNQHQHELIEVRARGNTHHRQEGQVREAIGAPHSEDPANHGWFSSRWW